MTLLNGPLGRFIIRRLRHRVDDWQPPCERRLNLRASKKDTRDKLYAVKDETSLPARTSLFLIDPRVKDQGPIGSCASFATVRAVRIACAQDNARWDDLDLSERFHYYIVRSPAYEDTLPSDSGQSIRDALRVATNVGIPPGVTCPYNVALMNEQPSGVAYGFAGLWRIRSYHACPNLLTIKTALAHQAPVVFGIRARQDIYTPTNDGDITGNGPIIGGHALCAIGYDDDHKNPDKTFGAVQFTNSWDVSWGDNGRGWISYSLLTKDLIEAYAVITGPMALPTAGGTL